MRAVAPQALEVVEVALLVVLGVLIVIPAWNEEESLPHVLAEVRGAVPHADVVVVNDGSTDATSAPSSSARAAATAAVFAGSDSDCPSGASKTTRAVAPSGEASGLRSSISANASVR